MSLILKKRKKRQSMYDPFEADIKKWCDAGIPVIKMIERLGPGYTKSSLAAYIRSHRLRTKQAVFDARNKCDKCEHCHVYLDTRGNYHRICAQSWREIHAFVKHRPEWCEKEVRVG